MNKHRNLVTALALGAAATLAACASAPTTNPMLDDARAAYQRAAADAQVVRSAPVDLQKARSALQQGEEALAAGEEPGTVEHFAYLAMRRTEAAVESGKIAAADVAVAAAGAQRERILAELRTREAEGQRRQAQVSLAEAEAARGQAESARRQAEAARGQAEAERKQAEQQLAEAQAARAASQAVDERSRKLAAQLEEMKAKKTERGMVLTLGDVLFDSGRADMKAGALRTLGLLAAFLKENPERDVAIEGHTDSVGSAEYNQALSERRALTVKNALLERGIAANRVTASGFGPTRPLVGNDTPVGRQQNRRVEIVLPGTN